MIINDVTRNKGVQKCLKLIERIKRISIWCHRKHGITSYFKKASQSPREEIKNIASASDLNDNEIEQESRINCWQN